MKRECPVVMLLTLTVLFMIMPQASGGVIVFDHATDSIVFEGESVLGTAATYEAVILFTGSYQGLGFVWNEHQFFRSDKQFKAGPNRLSAFSNGLTSYEPAGILADVPIVLNVWHHIAYVYDGGEERLYLDGELVASHPSGGDIAEHRPNEPGFSRAVGSVHRDDGGTPARQAGFIGYLDSLRISNSARYAGNFFCHPLGDLSGDSNTLLLYNFNEGPQSIVQSDESGHGRIGRLCSGTNATCPRFTSDPIPFTLGDNNRDGLVTISDHAALAACFSETSLENCCGERNDLDASGDVDLHDVAVFMNNFGRP